LLEPKSPIAVETNPDTVEYQFIDMECRDILLEDAPVSDSINVLNAVSRYVAEQMGKSLREFMTILKAPTTIEGEQVKPFAEIAARVLRTLGAEYARLADELEQNQTKVVSKMNNDATDEIKEIVMEVNELIIEKESKGLSNIEKQILEQSLKGKTYREIAELVNINYHSITRHFGNTTWIKITRVLQSKAKELGLRDIENQRIGKKNSSSLKNILLQFQANTVLPSFVHSFDENSDSTNKNTEFSDVLEALGIIGGTLGIENNRYSPIECLKRVRRNLSFLGILGSKWVHDNESMDAMRLFLSQVKRSRGKVEFLLISPLCDEFKNLCSLGKLSGRTESLQRFKELMTEFDCLEVKFYNQLPCFRLIFMDSSIVAVSKYRIDRGSNLKDKSGWAVPHLVIQASAEHSLYDSFEGYFKDVWERSIPLMEISIPQNRVNINE